MITYTASCCSRWSSSSLSICDCFLFLSLFARSSLNSTFIHIRQHFNSWYIYITTHTVTLNFISQSVSYDQVNSQLDTNRTCTVFADRAFHNAAPSVWKSATLHNWQSQFTGFDGRGVSALKTKNLLLLSLLLTTWLYVHACDSSLVADTWHVKLHVVVVVVVVTYCRMFHAHTSASYRKAAKFNNAKPSWIFSSVYNKLSYPLRCQTTFTWLYYELHQMSPHRQNVNKNIVATCHVHSLPPRGITQGANGVSEHPLSWGLV